MMEIMDAKTRFSVDVLCIGHATFDLTMLVDHQPGPNEKCFASGLLACGGGPAANAAVAVTRLGGSSAFAGYLGHDFFGNQQWNELRAEGVNTELVARGLYPTPLSVILAKPGGERTVVNHKAGTPFLMQGEIDFSACTPKAILFDGHEPIISTPLAKTAQKEKIITVLDAGSVNKGTTELVSLVDYIVASEKFARDYTGEKEPERAMERLGTLGSFVAITMGEKGLIWKHNRESGAMRAFRIDTIDTTGAGDTFHGAFTLKLTHGSSIDSALRYASAAAALTCTRIGARVGIPKKMEVDSLLNPVDL